MSSVGKNCIPSELRRSRQNLLDVTPLSSCPPSQASAHKPSYCQRLRSQFSCDLHLNVVRFTREAKRSLQPRGFMDCKYVVLGALVASLMFCDRARATFTVFNTPSGASVSGGAVNASVSFTTSSNEIQITLQNLQADPKSVGQNLSALVFTLGSGQQAGSIISSSGLERTVNSDGTYSDGSTVAACWVLSGTGGSLQLDVLSGLG